MCLAACAAVPPLGLRRSRPIARSTSSSRRRADVTCGSAGGIGAIASPRAGARAKAIRARRSAGRFVSTSKAHAPAQSASIRSSIDRATAPAGPAPFVARTSASSACGRAPRRFAASRWASSKWEIPSEWRGRVRAKTGNRRNADGSRWRCASSCSDRSLERGGGRVPARLEACHARRDTARCGTNEPRFDRGVPGRAGRAGKKP